MATFRNFWSLYLQIIIFKLQLLNIVLLQQIITVKKWRMGMMHLAEIYSV